MPIYEYRCASCGFEDEFLQKVSEPKLTECPKCGKPTFEKLMSAAGFQLKGNGWYATDFKNSGAKPAAKDKSDAGKSSAESSKPASETSSPASEGSTPAAESSKPAADKPTETKKETKSESA
jgi:putative FmdB family regulatory protein